MLESCLMKLVGCLLLADDDQIVDVAENSEVVAYPDASITFKLFKMYVVVQALRPDVVAKVLALCASHCKALLRRQMMLVSWMNSRGGTTKISVVMGVFKKADDTSQDVTCQL